MLLNTIILSAFMKRLRKSNKPRLFVRYVMFGLASERTFAYFLTSSFKCGELLAKIFKLIKIN